MQHYLILAQSDVAAKALDAWRRLLLGQEPRQDDKESADTIIVKDTDNPLDLHGLDTYRRVVQGLDALVDFDSDFGSGRHASVLVDAVDVSRLNPISDSRSWEKLIAMLVLTFPEIRWLFGLMSQASGAPTNDDEPPPFPSREHCLLAALRPSRSSLFDPTGLRDYVRGQASAAGHGAEYLPRRSQFSAALDEERSYAYLHAYAAYRFGFRALPVDCCDLARDTFAASGADTRPPLAVVFEDLYLNFPDTAKWGFSTLYYDNTGGQGESKGRCVEWPRLTDAQHRIFVTCGLDLQAHAEKHTGNREYLARQRVLGKHVESLLKPCAGMFKLWSDAGLARQLHKGLAEGFKWPPENNGTDRKMGHSSPGLLLTIAEALLDRAERLEDSETSGIEQAVRGAVLATDSLELLGCRTGTVAMEALRVKHRFELRAECQFSGVEYHLDVTSRSAEAATTVKAISKWFSDSQSLSFALNAEMQLTLDLVKIAREYGQFDEENMLMARVRHLHNSLWLQTSTLRRLVCGPFVRYVEFLLRSFPRFVASIFVWVVILCAMFWYTGLSAATASPAAAGALREGVRLGMESFVGNGAPAELSHWSAFMFAVGVCAGMLHMSVFFAMLYSIVIRK